MIRLLTTGLVVFIWAAVAAAVWFERDFRRGLDDKRFARRNRVQWRQTPPRFDGGPRRVADPSPRPRKSSAA